MENIRIFDKKCVFYFAVKHISQFEDCKLSVYMDIAGHKTIGYGHKLAEHENFERISEVQADALLFKDVNKTIDFLERHAIHVVVNSYMMAALVSLTYNIGTFAFENSTLLEYLNKSDYENAAKEILRWNKATINGQKQVIKGLANRREAEYKLFMKGFENDSI